MEGSWVPERVDRFIEEGWWIPQPALVWADEARFCPHRWVWLYWWCLLYRIQIGLRFFTIVRNLSLENLSFENLLCFGKR